MTRAAGAGAALPGEAFMFVVEPDVLHRFLGLAAMVVESNDAFIAPPPPGVALIDDAGALREAADVEASLIRLLAIWDAGADANEVPGVGPNQAPRQAVTDTGPTDPTATVRRYDDATNDLAGPLAGGLVSVDAVRTSGLDFDITVTNTSDETAYPALLTRFLVVVHDGTGRLFESGELASRPLERLPENGDPAPLSWALAEDAAVGSVSIEQTPDGAAAPGPLEPGDSFVLTVTTDGTHRWLDLAAMVVPSNDTFLATSPGGVTLLDESGAPRAGADIVADLDGLIAWDAGTEANQAGAAGADQAPRQLEPDLGQPEGSGLAVEQTTDVWSLPPVADLVRVVVTPID